MNSKIGFGRVSWQQILGLHSRLAIQQWSLTPVEDLLNTKLRLLLIIIRIFHKIMLYNRERQEKFMSLYINSIQSNTIKLVVSAPRTKKEENGDIWTSTNTKVSISAYSKTEKTILECIYRILSAIFCCCTFDPFIEIAWKGQVVYVRPDQIKESYKELKERLPNGPITQSSLSKFILDSKPSESLPLLSASSSSTVSLPAPEKIEAISSSTEIASSSSLSSNHSGVSWTFVTTSSDSTTSDQLPKSLSITHVSSNSSESLPLLSTSSSSTVSLPVLEKSKTTSLPIETTSSSSLSSSSSEASTSVTTSSSSSQTSIPASEPLPSSSKSSQSITKVRNPQELVESILRDENVGFEVDGPYFDYGFFFDYYLSLPFENYTFIEKVQFLYTLLSHKNKSKIHIYLTVEGCAYIVKKIIKTTHLEESDSQYADLIKLKPYAKSGSAIWSFARRAAFFILKKQNPSMTDNLENLSAFDLEKWVPYKTQPALLQD